MDWKSWLLISTLLTLSGFIIWVFASAVIPEDAISLPENAAISESISVDRPLISFIDPQKGADDPRITVIEYGDYSCQACRQAHEDIERLLAAHPDVAFVWKDLPSENHPGSDIAAEAAHCAKDQGAFWEYHEMLFERNEIFNQTSLTLLAGELELDVDRFAACLSGGQKKHLVERSISEAEGLGIDAIPYFFVGERRYSGKPSYPELESAATDR